MLNTASPPKNCYFDVYLLPATTLLPSAATMFTVIINVINIVINSVIISTIIIIVTSVTVELISSRVNMMGVSTM